MSGLFITMEGADGSGKTTQIELLRQYLEESGFSVVVAREPGGTKVGEKIRKIILDVNNKKMSYMTEAMLYASSRSELVRNIIMPELKKGTIVLCDRYVDSSIVYQGYGRGIDINTIIQINDIATDSLTPDITFLLHVPESLGMQRKKKQKELDRLEKEKEKFHKRVAYGYEQIMQRGGNRVKKIDATKNITNVQKDIRKHIDDIFNIRRYIR